MTIVTKPKTEKKEDKPLGKPLVTADITHCGVDECPCVVENGGSEVEAWVSSTARRRVSTASTICVCLTALLVMSIGIIGGVYLYRQFSRHQMARFHGFCRVPYDRSDFHPIRGPKMLIGESSSLYQRKKDMEWIKELNTPAMVEEEVDIDLENEEFEDISVPDFGFGRKGRFIHDFKTNQTGIIDLSSRRCFVMPLNRTYIYPPRTFFDLIEKIWMGYYNIDTRVVRQSTRVLRPPVEDFKPLGIYITQHCSSFPTFRLQSIQVHEIRKRSVDGAEDDGIQFVEFAGNHFIHLTIHDDGEEEQ